MGIGQEPYDQLEPTLKNALTEYFRVENLENLDEVKRAVAFLFYKHIGPIGRIQGHGDIGFRSRCKNCVNSSML